MKKLIIASLCLTIFAIFPNSNIVYAGETIEKKLVEKSFSINPDANLLINHEYGTITCLNWEKNEVSVMLTASVSAGDEETGEKAFKRISWEVKGNADEVLVNCKIAGKSGGASKNLKVDIKVHMPASINLNLNHKYGAANIENVNGVALISSDYGTIKTGKLTNPESKFKLSYGAGELNTFLGKNIIVQYSQLVFEQAADLSLKTEYSDVDGGKIENTILKLEGGNVNIKSVNNIKGSSSFSSLNIDSLEGSIEMESGYGSLNIEKIGESFSLISIENNFGSVNLGIPPLVSSLFEAESVFGSIDYPENNVDIQFREKSIQKTILKGTLGNSKHVTGKIILKNNYGNINISQHKQ